VNNIETVNIMDGIQKLSLNNGKQNLNEVKRRTGAVRKVINYFIKEYNRRLDY
jgi:hypothetical protein